MWEQILTETFLTYLKQILVGIKRNNGKYTTNKSAMWLETEGNKA